LTICRSKNFNDIRRYFFRLEGFRGLPESAAASFIKNGANRNEILSVQDRRDSDPGFVCRR
jgi:hypothetical protein